MYELYEAAFSPVNIVYTVLLIAVCAFWLVSLLGFLDFDLFGVDADVDVDLGVDAAGGAGGFSILGFLNVGVVPVMLHVSVVVLVMWVISVQVNHWLGTDSVWFALALAIPNLVFALMFAKFLFEPVRRYVRRPSQRSSLIGRVGIVKSIELNEEYGRCEVPTDSTPIIVNARTENGEVLKQGDPIKVIKFLPEEGFHIVTKHSWG